MTDWNKSPFPDEPRRRSINGSITPADFNLVRFCDISLDLMPRYLIDGLIPREGLAVIWGPPKCGKTFFAFDLVMHIALGWKYRGRRVQTATVVYVACEGERGLAARKEAFRLTHLPPNTNPPFYLLTTRLDLSHQADELGEAIVEQTAPEPPIGAIVLDTLNRSIHGSESKDEDMGAYVAAADVLRARFRCAVIIIHHSGLNEERPRGHTSLTGAVDAQIAVRRDPGGRIIADLEFMKDGPEGSQAVSKLAVIDVGIDQDLEPITSCVIVPDDNGEPAERKPKFRKLPAAQTRALEMLRAALGASGERPPASNHIPTNRDCVHENTWRQYCYSGGISKGEQEAKRKAFTHAAEVLIADGRVGTWNEWVWLP
jgi:hypothetical protein